jgi:hypothetical protein
MSKKPQPFLLTVAPDLLFQTSNQVLMENDASTVPENGEHAFSSWTVSREFFPFWEKLGDKIEVTGFSLLGHNAAPTLIPCKNAVQKTITLNFVASNRQHASSLALFILRS